MNRVFAVQELKRYHCPKCDGTYAKREGLTFKCQSSKCGHVYEKGIPKPMHSLTEASVFGQIEVLIPSNNIGIALQPLAASMKTALKDFDDDDYILPSGDPVAIGIAASIAAKNNRGRVNYLRWDRQTRTYIKITVTI